MKKFEQHIKRGGIYLHNARQVRILDYQEHNGVITVFAKDDVNHQGDPHCYKHSIDADFEAEYLPVDEPQIPAVITNGKGKQLIESLRDRLLEDIDKVRENKEYIPQTKQACNLVNTLVNLVKLEMQMRKG